ncbi:MAG: DUF3592 domain-containing protein [Deltaproteobacteria bacterium]|nr:DUF3592 domain-containing protein [Deltaproteobacteria bacterium]
MQKRLFIIRFIQWLLFMELLLSLLITFMVGYHKVTMILWVGIIVGYWVLRIVHFHRAKQTLLWKQTPAHVTRLTPARHYSKYGKGSLYLILFYQYTANGATYMGDLATMFPWNTERKVGDLSLYQRQPNITVHFNPQKPWQSVEKPGIHGRLASPLRIGISLFFLAFAVIYLLVLLR